MDWLHILLVLWSCCQMGLVGLVLLGTLRLCISHFPNDLGRDNIRILVCVVLLVVVRACASYDIAVYLVCVLCGRCALM